ncbi:sugar (pentulose or hexulose) kinase [Kineosporia succinea]|uniref:Sugar (Pentulose or hexulose) kinase n=1 Tax=Kineosporia succinea TaxID=84632 RepID=A0ABT9PG82_9ACTN|nr:FGGY-family carbohydrate kinase [Kineosporia succinea]MDP9831150.1 sugar (pentulose or hexulose) kinase [Kineosporia succinea]
MQTAIAEGRTALGIELGSTRIKATLIDESGTALASGSSTWENQFADGLWTYSLEAVHAGLRDAYADLVKQVNGTFGVTPTGYGALGVSAMMHGYLAFGADGELLVPFRTWRNTNTGPAAATLSQEFGVNIPLRWSVAHHYQALLDGEAHVARVTSLNTLAGYVHQLLSGRTVLGVGDASGMFPIDAATGGYDSALLARFDALAAAHGAQAPLLDLLPPVLAAGADAGTLTEEGAALLDPSGTLRPGALLCPPEGDAGTGMVATNAVSERTGNVSAGTSIFAMVVLERPLGGVHHEIDVVTTPEGLPVAMVHCNNGSSELGAWVGIFGEFAAALGVQADSDAIFGAVLGGALEADADGLLAYNLLSGEPIAGTDEGRPLFVRTPGSRLTLAGFAKAQLFGVFGTLSLGMRILASEGVAVDTMFAHGGLFRTGGIAQRALAAAVGSPVAVGESASEGGSWGIALLAAYTRAVADGSAAGRDLGTWLDETVFAAAAVEPVVPTDAEIADYAAFIERWQAGLALQHAAVAAVR